MNSWRIEVFLDGVLPLEVQHQLAITGWLSVWTDAATSVTSIHTFVDTTTDQELINSLGVVLRTVRNAPIGKRQVTKTLIETMAMYEARVQALYGPPPTS